MARRLRFYYPGATYHVMMRGNNGQAIFHSDEDRQRLCLLLQQGTVKFGHRIIAFCFMTNHIHLAVQIDDISISEICHNLSFRFTQYHNRKYDKVGHLFQGRFKSILVDSKRYLRDLIRYIHLNPVRADLVDRPEEYKWCSHPAYLSQATYTWLSRELGLAHFRQAQEGEVRAFEAYVCNGETTNGAIDFTRGISNGVLGDDRFVEMLTNRCEDLQPTRDSLDVDLQFLLDRVSEHCEVQAATLPSSTRDARICRARAMLALLAKMTDGVSLTEVADFLDQDLSSVSRAASRLETKRLKSPELASDIELLLASCQVVKPDPIA